MLRISKLADYGILILSYIAINNTHLNAREIAEALGINLPTIQKILKILLKNQLVSSTRGSEGGYQLCKNASSISMTEIINAIDGKPALTECASHQSQCKLIQRCHMKNHFDIINGVVIAALDKVLLSDILSSKKITETT